MDSEPSDWIVGVMMVVFGLIGLFMASRAQDDAIYLFGLSLAGFAAAFVLGLIRVHFERQARVAVASHHV